LSSRDRVSSNASAFPIVLIVPPLGLVSFRFCASSRGSRQISLLTLRCGTIAATQDT